MHPNEIPLDAVADRRALRTTELSLRELIAAAQDQANEPRFMPPNDQEARRFETLVAALATAARDAARLSGADRLKKSAYGLPAPYERVEELNHAFAGIGFELVWLPRRGWLALTELEGVRRGGGLYLCRVRLARPDAALVIQAPHSLHDQGTGAIARKAFLEAQGDWLMVNTSHRKRGALSGSADLAHLPKSMFLAATKAIARVVPHARFVQIHGFASSAHPRLGNAAAVLSQGSAAGVSDPSFDALIGGMTSCFGADAVRVFGRDAHELGATTNVQGRYLNAYTKAGFYHVELSDHARRRLRSERALRLRFADAIAALAPPPRSEAKTKSFAPKQDAK